MAEVARRRSPYKNFRFILFFDGKEVAGITKVGALKQTTQVIKHREGSDPSVTHKSPGQTDFDAITLERGVTHDREFDYWARLVWHHGAANGALVSQKDFRRDLRLLVLDEAGQPAVAYNIYNCWVSEYQALPQMDSDGNAVAIQTMTLQNEGWDRDIELQEPPMNSYKPFPL